MSLSRRALARRPRGLAMTELAIILPVILILIMVTAELGRAFWQYNILTERVREGARYAAGQGLFGSTGVVILTDGLQTDVANLVVYGNVAGTGSPLLADLTTVDVTLESPGDGDILVRTSYAYGPIFGFVPTFDGGGISTLFNFEAVMRMRAL